MTNEVDEMSAASRGSVANRTYSEIDENRGLADMTRETTGKKNVSQKAKKRHASRPVLWGLRDSCGLFEPTVYGTRLAAEVASCNEIERRLVVVPLYAKARASK
jgi:hypothetical protein